MKRAFTVKILDTLSIPATGRQYLYDSKTPSLALCVTQAGTKTFYLYRRVHGKPQRIRLGRYPQLTIDQARDAAARENARIADGADPQAERRARRHEMTLGELWDHYRANHLAVRGATSTRVSEASRFDTCWADWSGRRLSTITREQVIAQHVALSKARGHTTANRAVQLLRRIWNHGADHLALPLDNPARRVKLFREAPRERFLQGDELPRFFAAVEQEEEEFRDFFLLLLWTGARRGNVQRMRWADLHLDAGTWTIPAEEFKTRKPLTVPLAPEAIGILKRREATRINDWVFPSRSRSGHLVEPKTAWERIRERAKLADVRIHDLRRTLGSWQAALGTPLNIIGRSLGHLRQETTAIYARLNLDPVRASVNAATAAIATAAKGKEDEGKAKASGKGKRKVG
jgi:integrase